MLTLNKIKSYVKLNTEGKKKGNNQRKKTNEYSITSPCKRCLVTRFYGSSSSKAHSDTHSFKYGFHPVALEDFKKVLDNIHNIQY